MLGFAEMAGLMKNIGSIQKNMKQMAEEMQSTVIAGKDPSEKVTVEMRGDVTVQAVHIDPSLLRPENAPALEAACTAAMMSALVQFKALGAQKISEATGVNVSGMMS